MSVSEKQTTDHYDRVKSFMVQAQQECPETPTVPTEDIRRLRASIILEECLETVAALGFTVYAHPDLEIEVDMSNIRFEPDLEPNLVEIADGCADVSVVTIGTLVACGIPDAPLLKMVDQNNLEKFGPGSYRREDGKFIKPPGHQPPDIYGLLQSLEATDAVSK